MGEPVGFLVFEYPRGDPERIVEEIANLPRPPRPERVILALPENWISRRPIREEEYASMLERLYNSTGYDVLGGLAYVIDDSRTVSRGLAIIEGRLVVACEKLFPSKAVGERGHIDPGVYHAPITVAGLRVGCVACVDIFYPEVARRHVLNGAVLLYNPALIPYDRLALWRSVLATRAAENTVYVLGANAAGVPYPDGRFTGGGSIVYTPRGEALQGVPWGGGILFTLDPDAVEEARSRWAFHEDLIGSAIVDRLGYGPIAG